MFRGFLRFSIAVLCVLVVVIPQVSFGAMLYFDPAQAEMYAGDTLVMSVRLNPTEGECINTIDAVIEYDPGVQPVDVSIGQSIFPLWVEPPTIDRANNRITMAGGIPNGYCGRIQGDPRLTNEVAKIVFQVPGMQVGFGNVSPTTTVRFSDQSSVYLNDGRGSLASLQTNEATLIVATTPSTTVRNDWSVLVNGDEQIPEEFSITLQKDAKVFGNKYYIVFNTTDKQTGLAYYEVIEEPFAEAGLFGWGAVDAPWQQVRSPYVLKDQSLNSTIRVKAVDKAGNEYIATLVPEEGLRGIAFTTIIEYIILAVGAILLIGLGVWLGYRLVPRMITGVQNRRQAKRELREAQAAETDEEDEYEYVEEWVEVEVDEDGNEIEHT